MGNTKTDLQNVSREQWSFFLLIMRARSRPLSLRTVLKMLLRISPAPKKKQKERISKKRFLSVEIRFRIWRSISNLKSGIQNPNPADFPIERNLSKLQFRKLLSSGSTFTPKWLSDLVLAVGKMMILSKTAFWKGTWEKKMATVSFSYNREQTTLPASVSHLYASANYLAFSVFRDFIFITWSECEKHYANKAEIYASIRE